MRSRLVRFAKLAAYPLFYLLCLGLFGYLSFPFDRLKSRIIAEFDRMQAADQLRGRNTKAPMQLEIGELDGYWLSGVEIRNARLTIPPDPRAATRGTLKLAGGKASDDEPPPGPTEVALDHAHARVRILPLLVGRVLIDFGADVFGGEVSGTVPVGADAGDVTVAFEELQLGKVAPLKALTGLPVMGVLSGELQLSPKEGKFSKADGTLELRVAQVVIGDGKSTLQGVALPAAQVGDIAISAQAKDGTLSFEELSAAGRDFELSGDGRIRIREQWNRSRAEIYLKFRFTDAYRDKDDTTRSLLGKPGSKMPAALEFDPRVKRSKTADGYYGWHVHGALGDLKFDPQATPGAGSTRTPAKRDASTDRKVPSIGNRLKSRLARGKPTPSRRSTGGDEAEDRELAPVTPPEPTAPTPRSAPDDVGAHEPSAAEPAPEPAAGGDQEGPAESGEDDSASGGDE